MFRWKRFTFLPSLCRGILEKNLFHIIPRTRARKFSRAHFPHPRCGKWAARIKRDSLLIAYRENVNNTFGSSWLILRNNVCVISPTAYLTPSKHVSSSIEHIPSFIHSFIYEVKGKFNFKNSMQQKADKNKPMLKKSIIYLIGYIHIYLIV